MEGQDEERQKVLVLLLVCFWCLFLCYGGAVDVRKSACVCTVCACLPSEDPIPSHQIMPSASESKTLDAATDVMMDDGSERRFEY